MNQKMFPTADLHYLIITPTYKKMKKIAVLLTTFNKKEQTLNCLQNLFEQIGLNKQYIFEVFIVDGGSSDGTPEAIKKKYTQVHIAISEGLYWAGGMREAWKNAVNTTFEIDYFLLLNNDTFLFDNCIKELLKADEYARSTYSKSGVYIGTTIDKKTEQLTYGGRINRKAQVLPPNGKYQPCTFANANIMMIPFSVYQKIGGLDKYYIHSKADNDYGLTVCKNGLPLLILPSINGICANDHSRIDFRKMSLLKRIYFLYNPKGFALKEEIHFRKKHFPLSIPFAIFKLWLRTFFPSIWDWYRK